MPFLPLTLHSRNDMKPFRMLLAAVASLFLMAFSLAHADAIETRALQFAQGKSSATIKGSLRGDQTIDYTLRARAGQTMSVRLATTNGANHFNVLPPGSNDEAIFVGSSGGKEWTGALPADGEYKPPARWHAAWATTGPASASLVSSAASRAMPTCTSPRRAA